MILSEKKLEQKIEYNIIKNIQGISNGILEHAIIGISPFNSYFSEQNITKLISWSLKTFAQFTVFIPNGWSFYTLVGQGYTESEAIKKTKKHDLKLRNKVIRAFNNNYIPKEKAEGYILTAQELDRNDAYKRIYDECLDRFNTDISFREMCLSTSKKIISKTNKNICDELLHFAANYVINEMPLFTKTPDFLIVPSSFMVYHNVSELTKYIYDNKQSLCLTNQGYIVAKIQ